VSAASVSAVVRAASYSRNSVNVQHSIRSQKARHRAAAEAQGFELVAELADGSSASRYAGRPRDAWPELLELLPQLDVVMLWEASRGDRTLATWIQFLDRCRDLGVLIFDTGHGKALDPANAREYRSLAEDGVDAAYESDKISMRTRRGLASAAEAGRPAASTTYGYERVYHDRSGAFVAQREHPVHAPIVREIIDRLGRGESRTGVAADLTRRGVPTPEGPAAYVEQIMRAKRRGSSEREIAADLRRRGVLALSPGEAESVVAEVIGRVEGHDADREPQHVIAADLQERGLWAVLPGWQVTTLARIAVNPAYVGVRVHRPKRGEVAEYAAMWPALVSQDEHNRVVRTLTAADRRRTWAARPGRATTMVGNIAICGPCGKKVASKGRGEYRCCVSIDQAAVDELVTGALVAWVSDPAMFRQLRKASADDDRDILAARAEIHRLSTALDEWRVSAARGQTTPDSLAVIEADITKQLRDAQRQADKAATPPAVRDLLGDGHDVNEAEVRARLAAAPLGAQRDLVRTLMTVTVHGARERGRKATDRVEITWR
jgi:DNA invertase Pin-like site-specific DNA recombinase